MRTGWLYGVSIISREVVINDYALTMSKYVNNITGSDCGGNTGVGSLSAFMEQGQGYRGNQRAEFQ
jgi:hypothetical protein